MELLLVSPPFGEKGQKSKGLPRGVCIDTCHAYAAGYDLSGSKGRSGLIDELSGLVGIEKLKVIHLNDSKGELGTGLDRHEHIGQGNIGADPLQNIIKYVV